MTGTRQIANKLEFPYLFVKKKYEKIESLGCMCSPDILPAFILAI